MKWLTLALVFLMITSANAQSGSEIVVFDLQLKKGKVAMANPVNITKHKGYDNQPSFHPSMPMVFYSSFNDSGRAEIKAYNLKTAATTQVTSTREREYSPTVTPDGNYLSCIIQRDNGAQDLGKYPLQGGDPLMIVTNLTVGYHCWTDNSHVALFILGKDNAPSTLHYLRLPTRKDTVLATNIGRSLHRIPGQAAFSYVQKSPGTKWVIKRYDMLTRQVSDIGFTMDGHEDICWTPDGRMLTSDGTSIFWYDSTGTWQKVEMNFTSAEVKGITRLAVSADGTKLAIVVAE